MEMEVCHKKEEARSNNRAGAGSNSRVYSRSSQKSQNRSTRVVEEDPEMTGTFGGYQDLSIPTVHKNFFRGPNIDDFDLSDLK
mmetsp:Transcript_6252/g.9166  ORF Transcript_6252/g.9166 Transcript_6252/m.9166 type:complete len:83 (-) Transcript_6252:188-436(-)